jgi:hypothetical protein
MPAETTVSVQGAKLEESAGEVGEETRAAASMHSGGTMNGKRKSVGGVGPSESEQSTLKVNPEAPGWIKW